MSISDKNMNMNAILCGLIKMKFQDVKRPKKKKKETI